MSVPSNLVPTSILQLPEDPSPSDTGWLVYVNSGVTYKVQANAILNVSGVPTTRAIIAGTGLTGGGTLASNVTISVAPGGIGATQLDNTGVGAGVYGDSASYPVITVDANGRITAATELSFPSPSGYVPTSREVIAGVGLSGGGALTTNVTLDANLSNANPQSVGAEAPGTSDEISRADHVHPAIDLADTAQTVNELDITRGGTGSALTAPPNGGIVYSDGTALQVSTVGAIGQVLVSAGNAAPTWGSAVLLTDQPANYIYAGPTAGPDAPTAFRTLVNADLPNSGVSANTYGTAATIPVFAVNSKGVLTGVSNTVVSLTNANLQYSSITIGSSLVTLGSTITTLVGTSISGATNSLTNIPNSALTNNAITIGSTEVALGGTVTTLAGTSISGSTNTLTNIPNSALTNSSLTVNGKSVSLGGSTSSDALTIGTGLSGTSYTGAAPVTIAIDSTVVTLTGVQTLTNKTLTSPLVTTSLELNGPGVSGYTPFTDSLVAIAADFNGYREVYGVNLNNGSDASFDFVAYNDASDVNSYFIDMGMNSSNYTSTNYPIFTPNSGYLFTGGGLSGQQTDLFIGTSNPASDIIFFTGDVQVANQRAMFHGSSGNLLINTTTDTGYKLNVNGTSYLGGATTFGSTVTLNADPTLALQAATKQYVDGQVAQGFTVHTPVKAVANTFTGTGSTYNNGAGTITSNTNAAFGSIDGVTINVGDRVLLRALTNSYENGVYTLTTAGSGSVPWVLTRATDFDAVGPGEIANNAYFYVTNGTTYKGYSYVLSQLTSPIVLGTTPLPFLEFAQSTVYTGGTNIDITGQTISLTGTVAATNGGTGTNTVTTGDLLYGSAANTWSKLSLGSAYKSLVVNASGTQVEWNAVALNQASAVSGQLGVSNGGSGASTLTGYLKGNGTSAFTASSTIPNTDISGLGTMSTQNASSVTITGGTVNGTTIGGSTAAAGTFTTCTATRFSGIDGGTF